MREVLAVVGHFVLRAQRSKPKLSSREFGLRKVDLRVLTRVHAFLDDGSESVGVPGLLTNDLFAPLVVIEREVGQRGVLGNGFADVLERKLGGIQAITG